MRGVGRHDRSYYHSNAHHGSRRAVDSGVYASQTRGSFLPLLSPFLPLSSIPHAPFHWSDALLLIVLAGALLVVALSVQARRKE